MLHRDVRHFQPIKEQLAAARSPGAAEMKALIDCASTFLAERVLDNNVAAMLGCRAAGPRRMGDVVCAGRR
jgi:hypothetical protein